MPTLRDVDKVDLSSIKDCTSFFFSPEMTSDLVLGGPEITFLKIWI